MLPYLLCWLISYNTLFCLKPHKRMLRFIILGPCFPGLLGGSRALLAEQRALFVLSVYCPVGSRGLPVWLEGTGTNLSPVLSGRRCSGMWVRKLPRTGKQFTKKDHREQVWPAQSMAFGCGCSWTLGTKDPRTKGIPRIEPGESPGHSCETVLRDWKHMPCWR